MNSSVGIASSGGDDNMEASQQFHLKWNNHSLNTLNSFQHLLDTNTLVDVSLTASNGKTVTAHRMVLAACSEYFYRLFKDLPEKHPVIVFKDASEDIVRDLLLFMYKGEVEVQESHLNDFLKFADTLQVKGLSQSDREDLSARQQQQQEAAAAAAAAAAMGAAAAAQGASPIKLDSPTIKINGPNSAAAAAAALAHIPPAVSSALPTAPLPDISKTYLAAAGLSKFNPLFPLPPGATPPGVPPPAVAPGTDPTAAASAADLLSQFSSPNLYRALHTRNKQLGGSPLGAAAAAAAAAGAKFPDPAADPTAAVLGGMPPFLNLKKMFGGDKNMAAAAADLASLYPSAAAAAAAAAAIGKDDNDSDSMADHRSPPPAHQGSSSAAGTPGPNDENGLSSDGGPSPMEADFTASAMGDAKGGTGAGSSSDTESTSAGQPHQPRQRGGSKPSAGRGSRLERMIAAEYKIMTEYSEQQSGDLPVMTPELMKSRRTHSLQLAIGEILHNRASVQSAATKYHIPRETLRRHYQRYLKTLGIARPPPPPAGSGSQGSGERAGGSGGSAPPSAPPTPGSTSSAAAAAAAVRSATNNNKLPLPGDIASSSADESSNGFSSLMDIGQAYGIWSGDLDPEFKSKMKDEAMRRAAAAATMSAAVAAAAAASAAAGGEEKEDKEKQLVIDEDDDDRAVSPELDVGEEDEEFEDAEENKEEGKADEETAAATKDEEGGEDKKDSVSTGGGSGGGTTAPMETAA